MGDVFDVLINLITKNSGDGAKVTTAALTDLEAKVKTSNKFLEDQTEILRKQKAAVKELSAEYKELFKKYKDTENFSPEAKTRMGEQQPEYKKYLELKDAISKTNIEIGKQAGVINNAKTANKALGNELATVKEKEDAIRESARKTNEILTKQATILSKLSSQLTRFGTGAMVAGTAIVGGIVAEANRYAKEAGVATEATMKWNQELFRLQAARTKIDRTLVTEALPLLEMAAKTAGIAARFISSHPELVGAALKVGASLVVIGALAKALALPIKLVSDRLWYIAQGKEILSLDAVASSNYALIAANKAGGVAGAVGTGAKTAVAGTSIGALVAAVLPFVVTAAVVAGVFALMMALSNKEKESHPGMKWVQVGRSGKWVKDPDYVSPTTAATSGTTARIINQPYSDVKGNVGYQLNSMLGRPNAPQYTASYMEKITSGVTAIRQVDASLKELSTNYSASLKSITADFLKSQKQAETEYANQRSQIVRDGSLEIQRIEQDSQKRLKKLALEHEDKMYSLTLQRDALGIVQEQRDYARARDEEEGNTNLEIKRRRADIALKLSDMAKQYKAERALAIQQYQAQLNVEKQKFDAQRSILMAQRNDLLAFLFDEQSVKRQANAAILADFAIYAAAWRATLASALGIAPASSTPGMATPTVPGQVGHRRAIGGYADYGNYLLGDSFSGGRGPREFVLSGRTTRAAEQMLGGLNQQKIIAALSGGGGGVHIIDQSRYATAISASDRRAIRQGAVRDTMDIIGANK